MLHTLPETPRKLEILKGLSRYYHRVYAEYYSLKDERESILSMFGDSSFLIPFDHDSRRLSNRLENILTRVEMVTGSRGTPLFSPTGSQPLYENIASFHVPEGEGFMVHTLCYTIYEDMTAFHRGLSPEQNTLLSAYVKAENDAHPFAERHGNSLREMTAEESRTYDAFIESLKSPYQRFIDRLSSLVKDAYIPYKEDHEITVTYMDAEDPTCPTYQSLVENGRITEGDTLYYLTCREHTYNKDECLLSHYFIRESHYSPRTYEIVGSTSHLSGENARYVRIYLRDEDLEWYEHPHYFDTHSSAEEM